jgi:hypothetical protein
LLAIQPAELLYHHCGNFFNKNVPLTVMTSCRCECQARHFHSREWESLEDVLAGHSASTTLGPPLWHFCVNTSLSLLRRPAGVNAKVRHFHSREWESLEEVLAGHSASRALLGHWQVMEGAHWELDLAKAALTSWEASVRPDIQVRTTTSGYLMRIVLDRQAQQCLLTICSRIQSWVTFQHTED